MIGRPARSTLFPNTAPFRSSLAGNATVNEGSVYTLNLGNVVDPGTDTVSGFTVNWGDGSSDSFTGSPNSLSETHTYADGPASRALTGEPPDADGSFSTAGRT